MTNALIVVLAVVLLIVLPSPWRWFVAAFLLIAIVLHLARRYFFFAGKDKE